VITWPSDFPLTAPARSANTNGGTAGEAERDGTSLCPGEEQSDGVAFLNLPAKGGPLADELWALSLELALQLYGIPQPTPRLQARVVKCIEALHDLAAECAGSDEGASDG